MFNAVLGSAYKLPYQSGLIGRIGLGSSLKILTQERYYHFADVVVNEQEFVSSPKCKLELSFCINNYS